jgi:hypothetical protein
LHVASIDIIFFLNKHLEKWWCLQSWTNRYHLLTSTDRSEFFRKKIKPFHSFHVLIIFFLSHYNHVIYRVNYNFMNDTITNRKIVMFSVSLWNSLQLKITKKTSVIFVVQQQNKCLNSRYKWLMNVNCQDNQKEEKKKSK